MPTPIAGFVVFIIVLIGAMFVVQILSIKAKIKRYKEEEYRKQLEKEYLEKQLGYKK